MSMMMEVDEEDILPPGAELRRYLKAKRNRRRVAAGLGLGFAPATTDIADATATADPVSQTSSSNNNKVYAWAETNLQPLTAAPNHETPIFWHSPKSGGTTVKSIYECLDVTLANRAGALPKFGHDTDTEILAYRPWNKNGPRYVNVDTTTKPGIDRAQKMGLVPSGLADIIFTGDPAYAIEQLYDEEHKGRVFGLFRHPVDRLVSKFYYLQIATWERTYRPQWKNISILEFAKRRNNDNNHMVKKLAGKRMNDHVDNTDLELAKNTIRDYFIVGLMEQMEESIQRYNIVMDIDEEDKKTVNCMERFFGLGGEIKNSNSHPKLEEDDEAYKVLAQKNDLDVQLYKYILDFFEEQRAVIASYKEQAPEAEATATATVMVDVVQEE